MQIRRMEIPCEKGLPFLGPDGPVTFSMIPDENSFSLWYHSDRLFETNYQIVYTGEEIPENYYLETTLVLPRASSITGKSIVVHLVREAK